MTSEDFPTREVAKLPRAAFAFPGPLRDRLVEAILNGTKTSTTSLKLQYEIDNEPLPVVGGRAVLIDSGEQPVAVLETTSVRIVPLAEVDLTHARDEGEGYQTVAQWRTAHEQFFHSVQMLSALQLPEFTADDTTEVVLERFRVVKRLL